MERLIELLKKQQGKIVSSASCSPLEIAQAGACNRMFVDADGLGFIYFPELKKQP